MDSKLIKEVAEEYSLTEEEVRLVIHSMEDLVLKNIKRSTREEIYETRILSFGSFIGISDKAIAKINKNNGKSRH